MAPWCTLDSRDVDTSVDTCLDLPLECLRVTSRSTGGLFGPAFTSNWTRERNLYKLRPCAGRRISFVPKKRTAKVDSCRHSTHIHTSWTMVGTFVRNDPNAGRCVIKIRKSLVTSTRPHHNATYEGKDHFTTISWRYPFGPFSSSLFVFFCFGHF